jgi:flagellar biosynthesis protein FlhB
MREARWKGVPTCRHVGGRMGRTTENGKRAESEGIRPILVLFLFSFFILSSIFPKSMIQTNLNSCFEFQASQYIHYNPNMNLTSLVCINIIYLLLLYFPSLISFVPIFFFQSLTFEF